MRNSTFSELFHDFCCWFCLLSFWGCQKWLAAIGISPGQTGDVKLVSVHTRIDTDISQLKAELICLKFAAQSHMKYSSRAGRARGLAGMRKGIWETCALCTGTWEPQAIWNGARPYPRAAKSNLKAPVTIMKWLELRRLNLQTSSTLGTFLQHKRRVCIQFLLTDEGCWESTCPLHNIFLCSSVQEKEIHLEWRSCPVVPGKRHHSYFSLLSSGLQSRDIHVISSGFAGPYKPRLRILSQGHSELWLHLPITNYLDVLHLMKTNGLCNSCDCRCAMGLCFNPLAGLGAPSV